MLQSLWDYLRARARDAVLAGVNDAVEVIDANGQNPKSLQDHEASAARLNGRFADGSAAPAAQPLPEPAPKAIVKAVTALPPRSDSKTENKAPRAGQNPRNGNKSGSEIQSAGPETALPPRKRGRPPKNPQAVGTNELGDQSINH